MNPDLIHTKSPMSLRHSHVLIATLATLLSFVAGGAWVGIYLTSPTGLDSAPSYITVSKGMSPKGITKELAEKNLISKPTVFYWSIRALGRWGKIRAGEYEVRATMTPFQILSTLESGISVARPFTLREGQNSYELAELMAERGFGTREEILSLIRSPKWLSEIGWSQPLPPSAEGYLFPDTYSFTRDMSAIDVLKTLSRRFIEVWEPVYDELGAQYGFTRHQVVTLASMIEKETGVDFERPLISSVFHNRLRKHMRLQSDPTTIYGVWEKYNGNIRREDLKTPTDYNTYTLPALPIGPIGNPGKEAIEAALRPEQSDYLYFVSQNDGTHYFSKNYEEHLNAVRRFQLDPRAREGKSWRDRLNKPVTDK